jgi:hypothetical protein
LEFWPIWNGSASPKNACYVPFGGVIGLLHVGATEQTRADRFGDAFLCPLAAQPTRGERKEPKQTPFHVHWQPHGTARGTKGHHLRVRPCPNSVWPASSTAAARVQSGTSVYSAVREGGGAEHSTESRSNVDRSGSAVLPECEIVFPAKFQTCNGGDMVCVRGSLEARLAAKREGAARRGRIWNRGQPLCFSIA